MKTYQVAVLPVGSLLGLIFITLKLCGVITWSWWLVLAPFLVGPAIVLAFLLVGLLFTVFAIGFSVLAAIVSALFKRKG